MNVSFLNIVCLWGGHFVIHRWAIVNLCWWCRWCSENRSQDLCAFGILLETPLHFGGIQSKLACTQCTWWLVAAGLRLQVHRESYCWQAANRKEDEIELYIKNGNESSSCLLVTVRPLNTCSIGCNWGCVCNCQVIVGWISYSRDSADALHSCLKSQ